MIIVVRAMLIAAHSMLDLFFMFLIELMFLKELMFIKQANQNSVTFVTICIFPTKFQSYVCNRCHDLLMMFMNVRDIGFTKIKNVDYRCIITRISKSEAMKLLQNIDLTEKNGTL